uniref:Uncharacterized protein n=1 Tax=Hanusia phi TaxID=3032 RepID=A0A7S0EHH3_9CRYP|mmetsp:Transcript_24664/g.55750  ORF Transcript_24664/g.55750 Transcript_24664/m.55750 type:complete len:145 (+) Transcript_24664:56-490(+)
MEEAGERQKRLLRNLAVNRFATVDCAPILVKYNVFIGSVGCLQNPEALKEHGISYALVLCSETFLKDPNISYHVVNDLQDSAGANLLQRLPSLCEYIEVIWPSFSKKCKTETIIGMQEERRGSCQLPTREESFSCGHCSIPDAA